MSAITEADLSVAPGKTVSAQLVPDPAHQVIPAPAHIARLAIYADMPGIRSGTTLFMDAATGNALQYEVKDSGRRYRDRLVRFTTTGAMQQTKRPAGNDDKAKPATWTDRSSGFWPYPQPPGGMPVLDSLGLLYLVAGGPLEKPGDRVDVLVFQRRQLARVELVVDRLVDTEVSFRATSSTGGRQCKGTARALRIQLTVKPFGSSEADFEFLGLKSAIAVLVEPESRLIFRVEGEAAIIGRVVANLQAAQLPAGTGCPGIIATR